VSQAPGDGEHVWQPERQVRIAGTFAPSLPELRRLVAVVNRDPAGKLIPTPSLLSVSHDFARLWNAEHLERHHGRQIKEIILTECCHTITVDKLRNDMVRHTVQFCPTLGKVNLS